MSDVHYQHVLADASRSGVYHLPIGRQESLREAAEANAMAVFEVDFSAAQKREDMLAAIAKALAFPEWFGHNWDALADCLADMAWRPADGYLILLRHCDAVHGLAEADFVTLLQVFVQAAGEWQEIDIPFWVLVELQSDGINWLPDLD